MVDIRRATAADDATIKAMIRRERLDPTSLDWRHFVVAEADGQIVGIGQVKEYERCQELGSLVTLPEYRGRGIASEIMRQLEARANRPLYLLCTHLNEPFYARRGYRRIGILEAPFPLNLKRAFGVIALVFGYRIRVMRKD